MFRLSKQKQRGQVLVFTALLLPMMILFLVAAIWGGMLYVEYTRLQNAADSAALAGATSYAKYCEEHLIGATSLTKPFLKAGATESAQNAITDSVALNLPDGRIVTFNADYNQSSRQSTGRGIFRTYDYTYNVTSTVKLAKNIQLPLIGDKYEITAEAVAEQSFNEERGFTDAVVHSRNWDVKDSKLTQ